MILFKKVVSLKNIFINKSHCEAWRFYRLLRQRNINLNVNVTLMDSVIVCIHFGSNQPLVSLKITTAASLIREALTITPTNLLKQHLTY